MIRDPAVVRAAAAHLAGAVARAAADTVDALVQCRIEHEPSFTDRMLGAIESAMHGFEVHGVRWKAKTLTAAGKVAQEPRVGADFAGVLSVRLPDYGVDKGFLAQAKLVRPGKELDGSRYDELKDQCRKMLDLSPASFVFVYSTEGVRVVPAIAVAGSGRRPLSDFYSRDIGRFYEEHFESFIGDRRINAPTPAMLDDLFTRSGARIALRLVASGP